MPGSGYDGSIKIDTSINSKGFNDGVKGMSGGVSSLIGTVGKLGAAVGVAFSIKAVLDFGNASVDAASKLQNALIGLKSVVDGNGKSFEGAKAFIQKYTADGLVPATNAIAAYKNLLSRGYDTGQIEKTLLAIKDASAFGRQGSLSMGEAIQGATEGLKNENSILVDNSGITKNVSMMWKDYAASIGVSVTELTKEQKILAEVNGIMEESKFQTGDAAKLANTYSGKVSALGVSFLNLKVAVGEAIIPVLSAIIPYIKMAVDWLVVLLSQFAQFVTALFGVDVSTQATANNVEDAANAADDLATNTKKAEKNAKGALAAFDEINVLAKDTNPAGDTPTTPGAGEITPPDISGTVGVLDEIKNKVDAFKKALADFFAPFQAPLEHLGKAFGDLGANIMAGIGWVWENILKPLGEWLAREVEPRFLELLALGLDLLNLALEAIKPGLQWLWDNALRPLLEWSGQAFLDFLDWAIEGLQRIVAAWKEGGFWAAVEAWMIYMLETSTKLGQAVLTWIYEQWQKVAAWFYDNVTAPIGKFFSDMWQNVLKIFSNIAAWLMSNVVNPVANAFLSVVTIISDAFTKAFNGLQEVAKGAINGIIGYINGMIAAIATGINTIVAGVNSIKFSVPDFVPGIGGQQFGFSLQPVEMPQIPYLATGAVIPPNSNFVAMLGDQRSGRNLEAPESLIRQIISEEIGNIRADIKIDFSGNLSGLVRELKPYIDRENVRIGNSLIKSGASI